MVRRRHCELQTCLRSLLSCLQLLSGRLSPIGWAPNLMMYDMVLCLLHYLLLVWKGMLGRLGLEGHALLGGSCDEHPLRGGHRCPDEPLLLHQLLLRSELLLLLLLLGFDLILESLHV